MVAWSARAEALFVLPAADVIGRPAFEVAADSRLELLVAPMVRAAGVVGWSVNLAGDRTERPTLDALFSQSPLGLHIFDADLRVKRINPSTAAMLGRDVGELIGLPLRDAYPLEDPDTVEALARSVIEDGRPVLQQRIRAFIDRPPAPARTYSLSMFRLRSANGVDIGVAAVVVDVTELAAAEAAARVIAAVRANVGASLDAVHICREVAAVLTDDIADVAVVELVDAIMTGDEPPVLPPPPFVALHSAAVGVHGDGVVQRHGSTHEPPASSPFGLALLEGRPVTVTLEDDPGWLATAGDHAAAVGRVRPHALLSVPLTVRGTLLGLLSLYRRAELPAFTGDDADLAAAVADYVALCLENSRRYTREHAIAATVQRRLLPQAAQSAVALEIARGHLAEPQASGGWYDVVPLSSARTALVIGEVEGYGVYTSATMGQLRTALRSLATLDLEPDDLLARLDEAARHLAAERRALPPADPLREQALTASCVVAVYDPVSGSVTAARAGRPGLVLISPDGTLLDLDLPDGPLLGTSDTAPFAAVTVPQVPGGTIVALTSPALSDSLGEQGLRNILVGGTTSLHEKCDRILLATAAGGRPGAAITLLGRTLGLEPDATVGWLLDVDEHAPGRARRHVRAQLQRWGLPDETTYTTELLVSELVTNVLRYGESPCRLSLIRADHLTIEVSDGGASSPHVRHARTTDEGGRGLYIVAQMADRWGVRSTTLGKTVWAEQSLGDRPAPAEDPPGSSS